MIDWDAQPERWSGPLVFPTLGKTNLGQSRKSSQLPFEILIIKGLLFLLREPVPAIRPLHALDIQFALSAFQLIDADPICRCFFEEFTSETSTFLQSLRQEHAGHVHTLLALVVALLPQSHDLVSILVSFAEPLDVRGGDAGDGLLGHLVLHTGALLS